MEPTAPPPLPLDNVLPIFFLLIFAYGIAEFLLVHFRKKQANLGEYGMSLKGLGVGILAGVVITAAYGPVSKVLFSFAGAAVSPLDAGLGPLGWIYGFIIYELAYWLQHWLAHKVRLIWCLHSPHHAPNSMNMFVGFNHSFLETIFYMPFMVGFIPAILGVDPIVIAVFTFVDIIWGNILHISDRVVTRRWGILEKFMQTPSYHRVHHAQNVRYMDTNYNSITLLGDWLMGTLQKLDDKEPVRFGITRDVNSASFWDVHFGEFVLLWRDVRAAPSVSAAFGYLFHAPGWQPEGELKTAAALKAQLTQ
ncbi:MAG: sterol desaturase family protein [Halioglobus sp.]